MLLLLTVLSSVMALAVLPVVSVFRSLPFLYSIVFITSRVPFSTKTKHSGECSVNITKMVVCFVSHELSYLSRILRLIQEWMQENTQQWGFTNNPFRILMRHRELWTDCVRSVISRGLTSEARSHAWLYHYSDLRLDQCVVKVLVA